MPEKAGAELLRPWAKGTQRGDFCRPSKGAQDEPRSQRLRERPRDMGREAGECPLPLLAASTSPATSPR